MRLGVVVSGDGPSPTLVEFVVLGDAPVHTGQFVEIDHTQGKMIALVTDVIKSNRYFEHVEAVKEYSTRVSMDRSFPISEWEFTVAVTRPLAIWDGEKITRPTTPPKPGSEVREPSPHDLFKFIGFKEDGLHIGKVLFHDVPAKLGLTELFQKHLAILAMSGAGKSHLTSVLIEELLERRPEQGRVAIVIFDVHGEYAGFAADSSPYREKTTVIDGDKIKLSLPDIGRGIIDFLPDLSAAQLRELMRIMDRLSREYAAGGGPYGVEDLIKAVATDREIKENTRKTLLSNLENLRSLELFSSMEHPSLEASLEPGKLLIMNLAPIVNNHKRQAIVNYFLRRLFALRRAGVIPPTVTIVEEAHNFAPEQASRSEALSRPIIETIAREGRKFGLSLVLISQRPIKLSTTALSQCNTHIILRMTNPYDIDHVKKSSEAIDSRSASLIPSLTPGEALIVGAATNFPVFVKVRQRKTPKSQYEVPLHEMARRWEAEQRERQTIADSL